MFVAVQFTSKNFGNSAKRVLAQDNWEALVKKHGLVYAASRCFTYSEAMTMEVLHVRDGFATMSEAIAFTFPDDHEGVRVNPVKEVS